MKISAARFTIVLTLGVIIFAPRAWAQSPDFQQEGPREIAKCQTIDKPGSYKLVNNLNFTGTSGACRDITADFVTIDLAGFTISGPGGEIINKATGIAAGQNTTGITVRNGVISRVSPRE